MIEEIKDRLKKMRSFMRSNNIQAFIVPSTDPHSGEYIAQHWEGRKWISGFTGSAGVVVITLDSAGLWTDSRYFIQAEEQLKGTSIELFKERLTDTPSIPEWLISELNRGDRVGIDPWTNSISDIQDINDLLSVKGLSLIFTDDPFDSIWSDRPSIPQNKAFIHDIKYAGISAKDKIASVRSYLEEKGKDALVISALDEVCWMLNLRGDDVHCNPVFISYLIIDSESATLYIDDNKVDDEVRAYLFSHGVNIRPYSAIKEDLLKIVSMNLKVQVPSTINGGIFDLVKKNATICPSPILLMKAMKNEVEIEGFHNAMLRDGVAMVKLLKWIKEAVKNGNESELSVTRKAYQLRSEQAKFVGESFDTIAGYKDNAAIVHYEADEESNKSLKAEGMLLLDSGGQYLDGTTDITRTIILGEISQEERRDYTLVLKGMINLSMAEFPSGTSGTQLDAFARIAMWKHGINYMHGTGHGVGHFLNVHEGPHQIRMNYVPTVLVPGMTVTNEPGIYKAGRHGVRIENTMLIVKSQSTEFGDFYKLEPLTLCPIDREGIDIEMLNEEELGYLNRYHSYVYSKLSPLLSEEEKEWLKKETAQIGKK